MSGPAVLGFTGNYFSPSLNICHKTAFRPGLDELPERLEPCRFDFRQKRILSLFRYGFCLLLGWFCHGPHLFFLFAGFSSPPSLLLLENSPSVSTPGTVGGSSTLGSSASPASPAAAASAGFPASSRSLKNPAFFSFSQLPLCMML